MSLRVFHLFFIAASIVMCAVIAVWGVDQYRTGGGPGDLTLAAICSALGLGLVAYGLKVYRKFRELGQ